MEPTASNVKKVIEESLNDPLLKQADSPDFDLEAELKGAVDRIRSDLVDRRRTELMVRKEEGSLTPDEEAELRGLVVALSASKSGNQGSEEVSNL